MMKMKKYTRYRGEAFLFLLIAMLWCGSIALPCEAGNHPEAEQASPDAPVYTPENTILVFDLHGVLFQSQQMRMARIIMQWLYWNPVLLWYVYNPVFWYDLYAAASKEAGTERVFYELAGRYPLLQQHKKTFFSIVNAQEPQYDMFEVLDKAASNGYDVYIASNIGQEVFSELYKKHQNFFSVFKNYFTPSNKNRHLAKPDAAYFEHLNIFLENQRPYRYALFIDDLAVNCQQAEKHSFYAIQFRSAEQIAHIFEQLGIFNTF
jgi:FMN phosphatase YigB (HAD superfamily)